MNELISLFTLNNIFALLIAPPGWGKTRLLHSIFDQSVKKIIFVSPLRALAEEFANSIGEKAICLRSRNGISEQLDNFRRREKSFLIITPELMTSEVIDCLEHTNDCLIVLDEFHLYYYWGLTFREKMWEAMMGVINTGLNVLALTATMSDDVFLKWKNDSKNIVQEKLVIDCGNQTLKFKPSKTHHYPFFFKGSKSMRLKMIDSVLKSDSGTILLFVKYRHLVDFWCDFFKKRDVFVLGCKGGEVDKFVEKLDMNNPPRLIIATLAIGHGVNLPELKKIFIDYRIQNYDFWIQMVGRGGRRGERFELYTHDSFDVSMARKIFSWIKTTIEYCYLAFVRYFDL